MNRVGLGTFPLSGVFRKISREEVTKLVENFLENDGYYIDTAPSYGSGYVEELLGKVFLEYPRKNFFITTKFGLEVRSSGNIQTCGKHNFVIEECYRSLDRLKLDYIDLYLSHTPDPHTPFEETVEAMKVLNSNGLIHNIGVSNVSLSQLQEYNVSGCIKYVQNRYSILYREMGDEFFSYCLENGIKVIPYQVIERGLLTDRVLNGIKIEREDIRSKKPEFSNTSISLIKDWVEKVLLQIAKNYDMSLLNLAIWWVLQNPSVLYCICGATNINQLYENLNLKTNIVNPSKLVDEINNSYYSFIEFIETKYNMSIKNVLFFTD